MRFTHGQLWIESATHSLEECTVYVHCTTVYNMSSRVKTRRGVSGPKMDLLGKPDVWGNRREFGPVVFPLTCCESSSYISWQFISPEIAKYRTSEGSNMMDTAWPQEVRRVHSRSSRRPDASVGPSRIRYSPPGIYPLSTMWPFLHSREQYYHYLIVW